MPATYETTETTRVSSADLANLIRERDALRTQVTELQAHASRTADASLARSVRAFHFKFGHPVGNVPEVPEETTVRFRVALITEEFLELVSAAYPAASEPIRAVHGALAMINLNHAVRVDLPEFVDAMADLAYVIEGTAAAFGVHMAPVHAEVQRSNMAKDPNGPDRKPVKPYDWTPPDIAGVLRDQGWRPEHAAVRESVDDRGMLHGHTPPRGVAAVMDREHFIGSSPPPGESVANLKRGIRT